MQLGEVIFGGVGSGLYGMLVFAILAVFIAGLMIGRTPEYLGKKIEAYEMKMVSIVDPGHAAARCWSGTAMAVLADAGEAGVANPGAHGFTEILYAFTFGRATTTAARSRGSPANTPFYNVAARPWRCGSAASARSCRCSRIAGSLAAKKRLAVTGGDDAHARGRCSSCC